jgi:hypothetical protein
MCKDTRMLLVISNFVYLKRGLIPSMITQFESAFNVTIDSDKAVSDKGLHFTTYDWPSLRS